MIPTWDLPQEGRIRFKFLAEYPLESTIDGAAVVAQDEKNRRLKVSLKQFVTLTVLWRLLGSTVEQQTMLIAALRNTVQLKFSQLKYFVNNAFPILIPMLVKMML